MGCCNCLHLFVHRNVMSTLIHVSVQNITRTTIFGNRLSNLVSTMIETDLQDKEDSNEIQEIPLPNVVSRILAKVITFMHHHNQEPMVEIDKVT